MAWNIAILLIRIIIFQCEHCSKLIILMIGYILFQEDHGFDWFAFRQFSIVFWIKIFGIWEISLGFLIFMVPIIFVPYFKGFLFVPYSFVLSLDLSLLIFFSFGDYIDFLTAFWSLFFFDYYFGWSLDKDLGLDYYLLFYFIFCLLLSFFLFSSLLTYLFIFLSLFFVFWTDLHKLVVASLISERNMTQSWRNYEIQHKR